MLCCQRVFIKLSELCFGFLEQKENVAVENTISFSLYCITDWCVKCWEDWRVQQEPSSPWYWIYLPIVLKCLLKAAKSNWFHNKRDMLDLVTLRHLPAQRQSKKQHVLWAGEERTKKATVPVSFLPNVEIISIQKTVRLMLPKCMGLEMRLPAEYKGSSLKGEKDQLQRNTSKHGGICNVMRAHTNVEYNS